MLDYDKLEIAILNDIKWFLRSNGILSDFSINGFDVICYYDVDKVCQIYSLITISNNQICHYKRNVNGDVISHTEVETTIEFSDPDYLLIILNLVRLKTYL